MSVPYNKQPTVLIGLGGIGTRVVDKLYGEILKKGFNVKAFGVDSSIYDLEMTDNIPKDHFIDISIKRSIGDILMGYPEAKDWFPDNPLIFNKTLSEGAGQVRAVLRLLYEVALRNGTFAILLDTISNMASFCRQNNSSMRISIVTSLVGGTGSGIYLQIAMLIRDYLIQNYPDVRVRIHGEFVLPSNFSFIPSQVEKRSIESNAYAALKELNAINEHIYCNGPTVELNYTVSKKNVECVPYDYCFLYDRECKSNGFDYSYIVNGIWERLFGITSNILNEELVSKLRTSKRKRASNLYGVINTFNIEECFVKSSTAYDLESIIISNTKRDAVLSKKDIIESLTKDKMFADKDTICVITTPTSLFDEVVDKDERIIEIIDKKTSEISIILLQCGIEIYNIEELKYECGPYYRSYKEIIKNVGHTIIPHLNKNWHIQMDDIGRNDEKSEILCQEKHAIPKDSFVFISYSSKELSTAEQTRYVLENNGISCWMAPQSIPAGSDYGAEIPKAIGRCSAVVLLLSKASQESNWVPKEVGIAIGKGKIVIPFQIDDSAINDTFDFMLTNNQRIAAFNRTSEAYWELVKRLLDILKN